MDHKMWWCGGPWRCWQERFQGALGSENWFGKRGFEDFSFRGLNNWATERDVKPRESFLRKGPLYMDRNEPKEQEEVTMQVKGGNCPDQGPGGGGSSAQAETMAQMEAGTDHRSKWKQRGWHDSVGWDRGMGMGKGPSLALSLCSWNENKGQG